MNQYGIPIDEATSIEADPNYDKKLGPKYVIESYLDHTALMAQEHLKQFDSETRSARVVRVRSKR